MKLIENYLKLKLIYLFTTVQQVCPTGKNAVTGRWVNDRGRYPYPLRSDKYRLMIVRLIPAVIIYLNNYIKFIIIK